MNRTYITILLILFFSFQIGKSQIYWNDSLIQTMSAKEITQHSWIVDTIQLDINHIRPVRSTENNMKIAGILHKHDELSIDAICFMNIPYDTVAIAPLLTRSNNIHKSLIYFNIAPERIAIRDSIVEFQELNQRPDIAKAKIIVQFNYDENHHLFLDTLNQAFKHKNQDQLERFFENIITKREVNLIPNKLSQYRVPELIETFHEAFYKKNKNVTYAILPLNYHVEIGEVRKWKTEESYDEESGMVFAGSEGIDSYKSSHFSLKYQIKNSNTNHLFLNEELRKALGTFLGFEFDYELDSINNFPSNFNPIEPTKTKLAFLHEFIHPKHQYLVRGFCNAYMFWNHHWEFQDPYTVKSIQIDEDSKTAYISFNDDRLNEQTVSFILKERRWILDKWKNSSNTRSYILIISAILLISLFSFLYVKMYR